MTTDQLPQEEVFAVDLATLAREIAMDLFPLAQIIELHRLTNDEWERIQATPKFQQMLSELITEWNATGSTGERVKMKSATGLESILEIYIRDIADPTIPLAQRVEAGKFLARLGELDGQRGNLGGGGGQFNIVLNIGETMRRMAVERTIEVTPELVIPEG